VHHVLLTGRLTEISQPLKRAGDEQSVMSEVQHQDAETELIASVLAGNIHLFHELVRPYERTVYAMAVGLLRNEQEAEDVAQETFLKALRNLHTWRAEAKFSTWLITIALNEARARLRRAQAAPFEPIESMPDDPHRVAPELLRDWREVPSEVLERLEVWQLVQDAVTELPLIYREVFLLRDVEELSVNEAAEALSITTASVKVRLHRARIMLQKRLAPQLKRLGPKRKRFPW
jgi:RNA polymerase sigma-70 factor, ECF subfamily